MQLLRQARIQVGLVMILMTSVWGIYGTPVAQAEEMKPTVQAEWKDPSSGSTYYNWSSFDGDNFTNRVIVSTNDGKWARLSDRFTYISVDFSNKDAYPRLSLKYEEGSVLDLSDVTPLYLDVTQNAAVKGHIYNISPDGNWGLYETGNFGVEKSSDGKVQNTRMYSYFLKNMNTGEIQEWKTSSQFVTVYWLPDNKLLVAQYNSAEKQKEIVTFDPATGETKRLVLGRLYQYSEKEQKLVYVNNEPKRIQWVYDLKTGKSSLLTKSEEKRFYDWVDPRPTTKAPDNLDVNTLPIIDLPIKHMYQHEVLSKEDSVLVPFTFVKDGKTYMPLTYLLPTFKLSIGQREGKSYDYQYQLANTMTGESVTVDPSNSRIFQFRLYVTPEVLEKVGIEDVTVKTDMEVVIK